MTDNGSAYVSKRVPPEPAGRWRATRPNRPFRPRTNGKAERFIQTS